MKVKPWSEQGLILHLPLNETSGSVVIDRIAGNNGTLINNPTRVPAVLKNGIDLNGIDQEIDISNADSSLPDGADPRTITFFFQPASGGIRAAFRYGFDFTGNAFEITANDDALEVRFNGHRWGADGLGLGTVLFRHGAFVVPNGSTMTDDILIYLDGSPLTVSTKEGAPVTLNTILDGDATIGRSKVDDVFSGNIFDDIRVYDRQLSTPEILALSNWGG